MLIEKGQWLNLRETQEEEKDIRALLSRVCQTEIAKNELAESETTWVVSPRGGRILDIGFVPKRRMGEEFVGIDLFARPETIGIIVRAEEVPYVEVERAMWDDHELRPLLERGKRVVIATKDDLEHWIAFYNQVAGSELYQKLGKKLLDYSGLGRTDERFADRFERATHDLLEIEAEQFVERGVMQVELPPFGKLDRAFMDENGRIVGVPLSHVRVAELEGEILVEKVLSEKVMAPGVVVRRVGESKREAYKRARALARYWRGSKNWKGEAGDMRVEVPVISAGQLSIWKKLGMWKEVGALIEETELTAEEVIRFLYLGKSNIEPGELALEGLSLPGMGGEYGGVDLVFYGRGRYGQRIINPVDGLIGLNLSRKKKNQEGYLGLFKVAGIVIMPDAWEAEKMKGHVEEIKYSLNYKTFGPQSHLLYLTRSVFDEWVRRGTAFEDREENGYESIKQKLEYRGMSGQQEINLWTPISSFQIGNQKIIVEVRDGKMRLLNLIDWGTSFVAGTPALREMTANAPTGIGLRRQFETGELPMVVGIYDREYILASIKNFPALWYRENKHPVATFLRAEVRRRVPFEEVAQVVGEDKAHELFDLAKESEREWYGDEEVMVDNLAISHAHVDHVGDVPYLSRDVTLWGTAATMANLRAMSQKGKVWTNKYDRVSLITKPKEGSAYQTIYRQMVPTYWSGQRVSVGSGLQFEFSLANHSMAGMAMVGVRTEQGEALMLYTGDVKPGKWTERTAAALAGEYPVIMIETTNLDDEAKPSTGITEEMVQNTLYERIKEVPNDAVIVVAPPNHLERLESVLGVAEAVGRKLAISPPIAELVSQMRADKYNLAPLGVDGFETYLPDLGEEVALWWPPVTKATKYKEMLFEQALNGKMGIVDAERLSKEKEKWVILVDPYRILRHEFGGAYFGGKLSVLHSAHYPYQSSAKYMIGENTRWVTEQRGRHLMDFEVMGVGGIVHKKPNYGDASAGGPKTYGLHASGHGSFKEMMELAYMLADGRLESVTWIPTHGQHRQLWAKAFLDYFRPDRPERVRILANYPFYDPKNPIQQSGFRYKLNA